MIRVLFVCVHNSARSQIAEAVCNREGKQLVQAESAGLEGGSLNPFVVRVLQEKGIDISGNKPKTVMDLFSSGKTFDYVITVCSRETEEKCATYPGNAHRLRWVFEDPSNYSGTDEEIEARVRVLTEKIENKVTAFLNAIVF
jgi:arsenate reductase